MDLEVEPSGHRSCDIPLARLASDTPVSH
jgi:hypothetical protein